MSGERVSPMSERPAKDPETGWLPTTPPMLRVLCVPYRALFRSRSQHRSLAVRTGRAHQH